MPNVSENLGLWDANYSWEGQGDEWSSAWGGTEMMWRGALLPRVGGLVPTGTILEIAPGFGRWTQFLKDLCEQLVVVDLSQRCIDACRERFASDANIIYHVNDGSSLDMVADGSIDLAFSFDSLVHADAGVLGAYLDGLGRKLGPDGVAFIHHSNMGAYRRPAALARRLPQPLRRRLVLHGILPNTYGWRDENVTADLVARRSGEAGLRCVAQELVNWLTGRQLIDCISVVTPVGSARDRELVRVENRGFMREAAALARLASLYAEHGYMRGISDVSTPPGTGSTE
jgi:methyltransferase family protein